MGTHLPFISQGVIRYEVLGRKVFITALISIRTDSPEFIDSHLNSAMTELSFLMRREEKIKPRQQPQMFFLL